VPGSHRATIRIAASRWWAFVRNVSAPATRRSPRAEPYDRQR
jgi:hypothetical protein